MSTAVRIVNFSIGNGLPAFIIAEIGINHNGNIDRARELITAAKKAGANAVKFQSFKAEKMCDMHLNETKDVEGITGGTKSSYDMYKALEVTDEMHYELLKHAHNEGIIFFSSVFDEQTADFLDALDVPAYKIASGDLTHLPLIEHVAKKGKPILISTGLATMDDVVKAVNVCHRVGNDQLVLLHCVSSYPPPAEDVNLNAMLTMARTFSHPVGYSDHCEGSLACIAAVSMGATVIEKHFTLDNAWQGPDHRISLTAEMFADCVRMIRDIEAMKGNGIKVPAKSERDAVTSSRRSIRIRGAVTEGEIITPDKIIMLKPEIGLPPEDINRILGRKAKKNLGNHAPVTWGVIE